MDIPAIRFAGVGTMLPGPAIGNKDLIARFNLPAIWEQWIDTYVGTSYRHFAVDLDSGELQYSLADLGYVAGSRALAAAGKAPKDIDLMVMSTATPDRLMPATVNVVAERLGIDRVPTYQLQSGCTGAIQALSIAYHLLRSGAHQTALVLGADTCAKHFDLAADPGGRPPGEQVNGLLFGDGAGAVVLSTESAAGSTVIRTMFLRLVGMNRPPGQILEWFGIADRNSATPPIVEDYKAVEESVPKLAVDVLSELLDDVGWDDGDVDYLLPPQLSGRMTARIIEALNVSAAREVSCVAEVGNTGNSLPFLQLERALPLMTTGDRALGIAIEASKWIQAGFALETI